MRLCEDRRPAAGAACSLQEITPGTKPAGVSDRRSLRPQERGRNGRDAILAAICLGPGGDDHGVEQVVANLIAQPNEVTDVKTIADAVTVARAVAPSQTSAKYYTCVGPI